MGLFGYSNPAKKAQPYIEKIGPMAEQRYNPYIQQGQQAGQNVQGQYEQLTNDPGNFLNQLMSGYTPSKGFDFKKDQALQAMRNSAAAGGFSGTEADQIRQGELANSLSSQDMYDWVDRALGLYGRGLEGQQGFSNQGYNANQSLTDILGNSLNQQGGLAFQGQAQHNQGLMDLLSSLIGGGSAAYSAYKGGQPQMQTQPGNMSPMSYRTPPIRQNNTLDAWNQFSTNNGYL